MSNLIFNQFYNSYEKFPDNICVSLPEKEYTYREIYAFCNKLSYILKNEQSSYIGILAHRSLPAYIGILATLQAGKTYVPLNPKLPASKIEQIVATTKTQTIVADLESKNIIDDLFNITESKFIIPIHQGTNEFSDSSDYLFFDLDEINTNDISGEITDPINNNAYLLFTTGSTGEPKAIEISHQSLYEYLLYVQELLQINSSDKCSQIFDLSFDASVHDLFVTWMNGATLCIPERNILNPAKFVKEKSLTVWFSVPSVGYSLLKNNLLKSNIFQTIRISLFAGEQLNTNLIEQWVIAAPNSEIINLYGQTEGTVGISCYFWNREKENKSKNGNVSIGRIFPTQQYLVVDEDDQILGKNSTGELLLSGSQIINKYSFSGDTLNHKFVLLGEPNPLLYFRTGDIVHEDSEGYLYFLQRKDHEFKINGYRVDEEEINNTIRKITKVTTVVSIPYNDAKGLQAGIASFIESGELFDVSQIITECRKQLPFYMVPNKIIILNEMPLNRNGKVNRIHFKELLGMDID